MPESRKTSSSSSSPASKKPSKIPVRVEARPETKRSTRDTDELPAFDFDPLSPVPADVASRRREAESAPTLLHERFSFQAPGEEELRAVADVRELHDSEIDVRATCSSSPSTTHHLPPPTPPDFRHAFIHQN